MHMEHVRIGDELWLKHDAREIRCVVLDFGKTTRTLKVRVLGDENEPGWMGTHYLPVGDFLRWEETEKCRRATEYAELQTLPPQARKMARRIRALHGKSGTTREGIQRYAARMAHEIGVQPDQARIFANACGI